MSRRTDRPIAFYLNPTIQRGDYVTEKILGNPGLKPSFAHSYDVGYAFNKGKFGINTNLSFIDSKDEADLTFYQVGNIRYKTFTNNAAVHTWMGNLSILWNGPVFSATLAGTVYRNITTRERETGKEKRRICNVMLVNQYQPHVKGEKREIERQKKVHT